MSQLDKHIKDSSRIDVYQEADVHKEWSKFLKKIDHEATGSQANIVSISRLKYWAAAACLIGLAMAVIFINPEQKTLWVSADVDTITLPDGSVATLADGAHLYYPNSFENSTKRKVVSQGSVHYDVVENPDKPFIVNFKRISIEVLGTSFKLDDVLAGLYVENTSGKVKVAEIKNPSKSVILERGESILFTPSGFNSLEEEVSTGKPHSIYQIYEYLFTQSAGSIYISDRSNIPGRKVIRIDLDQNIEDVFKQLERKTRMKYTKGSCPLCYQIHSIAVK